MAFIKDSDSILITATLTEKGKKLAARGKFKVAKFTFADDEVDYRLFNISESKLAGYTPAIKNLKLLEASKNNKSINYGLNSYDSGILYLSGAEIEQLNGTNSHAFIEYLPILVKNTKTSYSPTVRQDKYYISINDETTKILNDNKSVLSGSSATESFKFLEVNDHDKIKIVVESGIDIPGPNLFTDDGIPILAGDHTTENRPTQVNRNKLIVEKMLLDSDFLVYADNRIISSITPIQKSSKFENYLSGEKIINFQTSLNDAPAVSLESEFDYFATYLLKGIPNSMFDFDAPTGLSDDATVARFDSIKYSNLDGPRGSVVAFNVNTDNKMKVNSTGQRDSRFDQFGNINNALFSEIPTIKFDYVDTTIYIVGTTSNARLQIPLRIIRYAGV